MAKSTKTNLEETFNQLGATIKKLEDESTSLQESLDAFEQGVNLTQKAQKTLLEAEQRVKLLVEVEGKIKPKEFDKADTE